MGSDSLYYDEVTVGKDFNPRSPHGERLAISFAAALLLRISIHAPRMGSDINRGIPPHAGAWIEML